MILRILAAIAGSIVAILSVIFLTLLLYVYLESRKLNDFISGNAGNIEKIIITTRFGEKTLNDKNSMAYLSDSFKTLRETDCSEGSMFPIYIYYKNRPVIYAEFFINGESPDKACLWINGSDGARFEFDLQKPFPEELKNMINYLKG